MSYNSGLKLFRKMLNENSLNRMIESIADLFSPTLGFADDFDENKECCHKPYKKQDFNSLFDEYGDSSLKDCGETYELVFNVDKNATSKNFDVDVEHNTISVKYKMENDNKKTSFSIFETLPKNADAETIEANVKDGVFTLKMDKLPIDNYDEDYELEIDDDDDDETIKINKK